MGHTKTAVSVFILMTIMGARPGDGDYPSSLCISRFLRSARHGGSMTFLYLMLWFAWNFICSLHGEIPRETGDSQGTAVLPGSFLIGHLHVCLVSNFHRTRLDLLPFPPECRTAMLIMSPGRKSNGSERSPSSEPPGDTKKPPTHIKLKLSPPQTAAKDKNDPAPTNENHQTDAPPNRLFFPHLELLSPTPTGSTIDTTARATGHSRACVVSESEISVLDLGPSLANPHGEFPDAPHEYPPSSPERDFFRTKRRVPPAQADPGHTDTSGQSLPGESLDPGAVIAGSASVVNDPPLYLRRHQPELHVSMPPPNPSSSLRRSYRNRVPLSGDIHQLGYGYGYDGFDRDHFHAEDEPDRDIRASSVSHSPCSLSSVRPARLAVHRSRSSFGGMDKEYTVLFTANMSEDESSSQLFTGVASDEPESACRMDFEI